MVTELLFAVFDIIFLLFLAGWLFFEGIFTFLIERVYSDVGHLIELEKRMNRARKNSHEDGAN
ncbi:MAG: hypothetical protein ACFFEE_06235 [Candidatus Thorarchaeota archaeon]